VPHAYPCANCDEWVGSDGRRGWVHLNGSYACRDKAYVLTGKYATPRPERLPHD